MTKMLSLELAKYKIRVNVICPGSIKTEIEEHTERKDVEKEKIPVEFPEGNIPLTGDEPPEAIEVAKLVIIHCFRCGKSYYGYGSLDRRRTIFTKRINLSLVLLLFSASLYLKFNETFTSKKCS
jgi:hypothetical protein